MAAVQAAGTEVNAQSMGVVAEEKKFHGQFTDDDGQDHHGKDNHRMRPPRQGRSAGGEAGDGDDDADENNVVGPPGPRPSLTKAATKRAVAIQPTQAGQFRDGFKVQMA